MTRPSFEDINMQVAHIIAQRSTCPRLHVGAVICTENNRIVATGYNGSLPDQPHCEGIELCNDCAGSGKNRWSFSIDSECSNCHGKGYTESPGCLMVDGHCQRTVHAEANAVAQAANNGISISGCALYTLASPCLTCAKLIVASGIEEIVFAHKYNLDAIVEDMLNKAHVYLRTHELGSGLINAANLVYGVTN